VHTPSLQASALVASHATQAPPPTPQALGVGGVVHAPAVQHPPGHDAALQTQAPPTHACPGPHGALPPHWHCPVAEQPSDVIVSQATHPTPPVPHAAKDSVLHVGPEQHPAVHVIVQPEQAPAVHACPAGHGAHVLPPLPHMPSIVPGRHIGPTQQPGHEAASHTQVPLRHCWPDPHARTDPQVHAPAAEHPSAIARLHAPHVAPGAPQVFTENGVHASPLQQPSGHDVASHTHEPCAQ
jgi:hypothetical protein